VMCVGDSCFVVAAAAARGCSSVCWGHFCVALSPWFTAIRVAPTLCLPLCVLLRLQDPLVPDLASAGVEVMFRKSLRTDGTEFVDFRGEVKRFVSPALQGQKKLWLPVRVGVVWTALRAWVVGFIAGGACIVRWDAFAA